MNNDALFLLQQIDQLPQNEKKHYLIYLDPPYYEHGAELYLNSYTHNDHAELASFLLNRTTIKWVLSYDNVKEIYIRGINYIPLICLTAFKRRNKVKNYL